MPSLNGSQTTWAMVAAFGTYFCVYAFRKPFTAGDYSEHYAGLDLKTLLVVAQVLGYTLSKFLGIKVVAELPPARRGMALLLLVGLAELALLGFALTPTPWNCVWLFFNGLPLGMAFGLVLGFLEGRRQTEALTAVLCASFIIADGATKSVGTALLRWGVNETWMPVLAGLIFVPGMLLFVGMLTQIRSPTAEDIAARSERPALTASDRWRFLRRYGIGLCLLTLAYLLVTVLRSVRADFAPEVWSSLGATPDASLFTYSEVIIAAIVLPVNASLIFVRDNRRAFTWAMGMGLTGCGLVAAAVVGWRAGWLSPFGFFVWHGLGLYLPYIVIHTTIFERLIAMTRERSNVGYLMYLVDAFGYLGYVGVLLIRKAVSPGETFGEFFFGLSGIVALLTTVFLVPATAYFLATSRPAGED